MPLARQAPAFADASAIPAWAKTAVDTAVKAGIVGGYPDGTFRAARPVTRGQAVSVVLRLLKKVAG